jgi:hypothetical protein
MPRTIWMYNTPQTAVRQFVFISDFLNIWEWDEKAKHLIFEAQNNSSNCSDDVNIDPT